MNADLVGAFNILKKAVKTITPNLGGLLAQGRGNGGKVLPEGFEEPPQGFFNENPPNLPVFELGNSLLELQPKREGDQAKVFYSCPRR